MGPAEALDAIERRAATGQIEAEKRWAKAAPGSGPLEVWIDRFRTAGRLTLNFHPDRISRSGNTVASGLAADGAYRSQWITGISSGSRSATDGGERQRFERELFTGAYDHADPDSRRHPVYGSLDLLFDEHGGSPRFGSSYLVLAPHVRERTTLTLGDSHMAPRDVGTFGQSASILAGLAEQAASHKLLNRHLSTDVLLQAVNSRYGLECASRELDGYVEVQVHGDVLLADDAEAVVLDPAFRSSDVERDLALAAERFDFELRWHRGSAPPVHDVPDDFRGPTMPALARQVAGPGGIVDARTIGIAGARERFTEPTPMGDPAESTAQRLKYLWHTVLAFGNDADPT